MGIKKYCLLIITVVFSACTTTGQSKYNLDFEQVDSLTGEAKGWFRWSDYGVKTDADGRSGTYSGNIKSDEIGIEGRLVYGIPANYTGKTLQLEGYMKTKEVANGFAGLFLKIENDQGFNLSFNNMEDQNVKGTNDWKKYIISVPYPERAEYIFIGGILSGKGEAWFDDFVLKIDGKDVQNLEGNGKKIFKAKLDREFDLGSNVKIPKLDSDLISNLDLLGRIWGFLKYHHSEVAKGNYNWDYELFRVLPAYLDAKNNRERDQVLSTWIAKYGKIPLCDQCKPTSNDAVLKPDLLWIDRSNLSNQLKTKLKEVYTNRHQGEQYYIAFHENIRNPDFTNENPYYDMPYPDTGFRLLSLFRYWNMINYFSPNKHVTDQEWNSVLAEYVPRFLHAKNELEYELAAIGIIGEVNDTHSNLWGGGNKIAEMRGANFAPFKAEFIENRLVVIDYYNSEFSESANLKIGDIITHINGRTVETIVDSLKTYYPSSNITSKLRDISVDLLRSTKNTINLKYISEDQTKEQDVVLHDKERLKMYDWYVKNDEKCYKILDGNIGYITLKNIKEEDIPEIKKSFLDTHGIIIDIRNYPSTFVPFALGSYFVTKPTDFVKFTQGNLNNPGEFTFREGPKIESDNNKYNGKLVVLVNERSQSQSEYTAMAFRAVKNSMIVGSTTAGADGNVSIILLPGGLSTWISGIGIYYPDGTETQRIGIVPDIEIKPTIQGIKEGRDEVLERAIQYIKED